MKKVFLISLGAGCRRFESCHSDQILEKPPFQAVFLRFRCVGIGIPPTVRIVVHRTCYDGTIPERQVRFMFYYSKRSHRKIVHTKSCFLVRAFDAVSAIRGYHNQHIRFRSLPEYFSYITSHDAFRMHHPEAPRAALAQKPPKQKEPPRKGTKRWHKEQTRRRAVERKRAIRNVLALIDSLDANYAARPAV